MTRLWRLLLRLWVPEGDRVQSLPPVPDPEPGPEYHRAWAQAEEALTRAEQIMSRSKSTRPA
ncbi:MAG: hypothetical protein ACOY93_13610 [Bacillota bacterium]